MYRFPKFLVGAVACGCLLAALAGCSSASSSGGTQTIATIAGSGGLGAMPAAACSLASPQQVKDLIGSSPAGSETTSFKYDKTCEWKTSSGSKTLSIGVIRLGNGQIGFYDKVQGLTPVQVNGLGSKATYLSGNTPTGAAVGLLVVNTSRLSLSLSVSVASGGASVNYQDKLTKVATGILTQLGG